MKRSNETTWKLDCEVNIDGHIIKTITFDLFHINHGWDKKKFDYKEHQRSSFTEEQVVNMFEQLSSKTLNTFTIDEIEEVKKRKNKAMRYKFSTDINCNGEDIVFFFVVDIFKNFEPQHILVTMYEPNREV